MAKQGIIGSAFDTGNIVGSTRALNVEGVEEIISLFKALPAKVSEKIQRKSMSKAIALIYLDVKAALPKGPTGNLRKSLKRRIKLNKRTLFLKGEITVSASHASWIENGFSLTGHKPDKKFIKQVPGRKILKLVFAKHANGIVDKFVEDLTEAAKEAQKEING